MGRKPEWHVLTLVTLALTAFGIVMVYSATSASAVVGGANPMSYLERQGTYAVLGIAGLVVASRWRSERLRALARRRPSPPPPSRVPPCSSSRTRSMAPAAG